MHPSNRPYLWAWTALKYYKETTCGKNLDLLNSKFKSYDAEHQASAIGALEHYRRNCEENYLRYFELRGTIFCQSFCSAEVFLSQNCLTQFWPIYKLLPAQQVFPKIQKQN